MGTVEKDVIMRRGNVVSIKGNATKDVEIRRTSSGANMCAWCIAWNDSRKGKDGEWVDIPNFFGGHLEQRSWEKDGRKYSKVVIRVDDPVSGLMLEAKQAKQAETVTAFEYDIPF